MGYSDFDLPRAQADFNLTVQTVIDLFAQVPPVAPDPAVAAMLNRQIRLALAINTEKARSEWLIAPLLGEVWRLGEGRVSLHSGVPLDVDAAAGLVGRCDFLLGRPPQLHYVTAPLLVVIEAKNEDIAGGLGQCAAAMIAAQRFNRRQKTGIETIYGCVSDGAEWKFLRLAETVLTIDLTEYLISQPDRILGVLLHAVGMSPAASAA
jgi:hypothetical protein